MFLTFDEPRVMLCCFAFGGLIGFLYELFYFLGLIFKSQIIKHVLTCVWWVLDAFIFVFFNYFFHLGNFRIYKIAVILVGFIFYFNSFHKIIAIFLNKVYNKYDKFIKKVKVKKVKNDATKKEKSAFGTNIRRNNAVYNISGNTCLSSSEHSAKVQRNKKVGRRNLPNPSGN